MYGILPKINDEAQSFWFIRETDMTDYEKDYNKWKNDQSFSGRYDLEPKRSDYDEYGFKPNNVIYEKKEPAERAGSFLYEV